MSFTFRPVSCSLHNLHLFLKLHLLLSSSFWVPAHRQRWDWCWESVKLRFLTDIKSWFQVFESPPTFPCSELQQPLFWIKSYFIFSICSGHSTLTSALTFQTKHTLIFPQNPGRRQTGIRTKAFGETEMKNRLKWAEFKSSFWETVPGAVAGLEKQQETFDSLLPST